MSATRPSTAAKSQTGHESYECARAWVALRAAYEVVAEKLTGALERECGLTMNDFEILVRLNVAGENRLRLSDLLSVVPLSQPALSRLVARLEGRGLIDRCEDDADRRAVLLGLTDAGQSLLQRAIPIHAACVRDALTGRLSDEQQEVLVQALGQL